MKVYAKETVQYVNASVEECWAFFSSPKNLQKITPEDMGFQITDFDNKPMYAGQIIQYKVSPLLGLKLSWMTVITYVKDNSYFVDEQRFVPYALWHHEHRFVQKDGYIEMTDTVHYALKMGILGRIVNQLYIRKKLHGIFAFREKKVAEIFGN